MPYGNTYVDQFGRPVIEGTAGQDGGGPAVRKQFIVDTGGEKTNVDPDNVTALNKAGVPTPPTGGAGASQPSTGNSGAALGGLVFTVPVWDPATGTMRPGICNLDFVSIAPGTTLGVDQLDQMNAGLPMGNAYPGHQFKANEYFHGNSLLGDYGND